MVRHPPSSIASPINFITEKSRTYREISRDAHLCATRWPRYTLSPTIFCLRHHLSIYKALKFIGPNSDVPWQRVVSASGKISSRGPNTEGADRQRIVLEGEGVIVQDMRISWAQYGWFPEDVDLNA